MAINATIAFPSMPSSASTVKGAVVATHESADQSEHLLLDHEIYDYYTEEEKEEIVAEIYGIFGKPTKWNTQLIAIWFMYFRCMTFALFLEVISSLAYHAWWVGQVNHFLKADDNKYTKQIRTEY